MSVREWTVIVWITDMRGLNYIRQPLTKLAMGCRFYETKIGEDILSSVGTTARSQWREKFVIYF